MGKTNLVHRFVKPASDDCKNIPPTIGVEFGGKTLEIHRKRVCLQIWDTAGQESFRSITRAYYRGAAVALIVYDIANRASFANVKLWIEECYANTNQNFVLVLVGNKTDLESARVVSAEEGQAYANSQGMLFVETSAKDNTNVAEAFELPAREILHKIETKQIEVSAFGYGIKLGNEQAEETQKTSCCKRG